jgi:hypothetical protein
VFIHEFQDGSRRAFLCVGDEGHYIEPPLSSFAGDLVLP